MCSERSPSSEVDGLLAVTERTRTTRHASRLSRGNAEKTTQLFNMQLTLLRQKSQLKAYMQPDKLQSSEGNNPAGGTS